jgi:tRNA(fMet)-specific endonuclease VapC
MGERFTSPPEATDKRGAALERLILDTTVLISAERRSWDVNEVFADEDDLAIAAITAAELMVGVEMADSKHRTKRKKYVEDILVTIQIENYDLAVARSHSQLLFHVRKTGRPRGAHDLIIAATAISSGRSVITADEDGFKDLPGVNFRALP